MPGVDHSTRIGSIGIKSGSVGITDGDIHVTGGSIDTTIIGSVPVYGDVEVGTVPVIGAFYPGSQKVYGDVEVGTVPVIGDFYPGTQNVGVIGSVEIYGDIEVGTVPVIGDFYPGSQKVYGDIEVGTVPVIGNVEVGTVPVIGDFYPATQPVSGSVGIKSGSVGILGGKIKITDGTTEAAIDPDSKSIHTIHGEHMKLHEGKQFRTCRLFPSVADNGSAHMLLYVGSVEIHGIFGVVALGNAHARLFEGATPAYIGTETTIRDMNRTTKNTSKARAYYDSTFGTLGTPLACIIVPGGTKKEAIGGEQKEDSAWILGTFANYVVQIVNKAGDAKDLGIELEFFEK